jgi:pyridoxine 4-dehydrogenase
MTEETRAMAQTTNLPTASASGTFTLGGDLPVHRLGFGAMRITGPGVWGEPPDREEAKRVLRRAIELDINLIDTADSYGPEVSERLIAETLYPYPDGLVIATKGGYERPGPGQWRPNGRPEHLRQALEGSLRRLKLESIDLYQLHVPDPKVPFAELVGALAEMQAEGKIHHIGLSNVNTKQLAQARSIAAIVSVQNRFNLFDRSSEGVLDVCTQDNLGFLPWNPLAITQFTVGTEEIAAIARAHSATLAQLELAWLLQRSPVMLPIPGTSTVTHLEENVAAVQIKLSRSEFLILESANVTGV